MSPSKPPAFVHVDCDGLWSVQACYGESPGIPERGDPFWVQGMPVLMRMFREFDLRATFFVVSNDVTHSPVQQQIAKAALDTGHEIACHSHSHEMNMRDWDALALERDLRMAKSETEVALDTTLLGFRAPGFSWHPRMAKTIAKVGFEWDSSLFPSPWGAALRLLRRRMAGDRAVVQSPYGAFECGFAKRRPHRMEQLVEVPVSVSPGLRFPVHASFALLEPMKKFKRVVEWHAKKGIPFVWLIHLIDVCDTENLDLPVPDWAKKTLCRSDKEKNVGLRQMLTIIQEHFEIQRTDEWVRSAFQRH